MGFFSGIGDAIKGVVGAIAEPISSIAGIAGDIMGVAAPVMEAQSVAGANEMNREIAFENREWQGNSNRDAMAFTAGQNEIANDLTRELQGKQFDFNRSEAQAARDFSERMSGTSYQRAVKDLAAAGLNPMLAVSQGGSSTPGASMASGGTGSGTSGSGVSSAGSVANMAPAFSARSVASAAQARVMGAQVANVQADTVNKLLQSDTIRAETNLKGSQSYQATTQGHVNQATESKILKTIEPLLDQIRASAEQSRASAGDLRAKNALMKALQDNPVTAPFAPLLNIIFR